MWSISLLAQHPFLPEHLLPAEVAIKRDGRAASAVRRKFNCGVRMAQAISGWKITAEDRGRLLALFRPRYAQVVADHVTYRYGAGADAQLPKHTEGEIVGEANDGLGVQALVVRIGGATDRGDGRHFHITWSLGNERRAEESNDVIAAQGWTPVAPPVPLSLWPARWQG